MRVTRIQRTHRSLELISKSGQLTVTGYLSSEDCGISDVELTAMLEDKHHYRNHTLRSHYGIDRIQLLTSIKYALDLRTNSLRRERELADEYLAMYIIENEIPMKSRGAA